jgi:transposase
VSKELSKKEVYERMVELRNLRKLHASARARIQVLEEENRVLKASIVTLQAENAQLKREYADVRYQLEEIKTLLFGKKRTARATLKEDDDEESHKPPRTPRSPDTYRRPIPTDDEVTKTVYHRFPRDKKGNIRLRTYYVEDIPLDIKKVVEKHVVEQWYDHARRMWVSKDPLPSASVTLGDNVRALVATLITVQRLSYEQVRTLLTTLFHLTVSDGEIAKICTREATYLTPTACALLDSIREEPSHHMDESRYDVNGEARYVWSITGGESGNTVYRVGVSRGKGIAEELRGESTGVLISDDYGAYRTLGTHHQLCWAHLIRKFRDLGAHEGFTDVQKEAIRLTYREVKAIYHTLVTACVGPDPQRYRTKLTKRFHRVSTIHEDDPTPAVRLKTTLQKNISRYLTCLSFPTIARTNNTAERSLRHVVLKRKNSFGCKSNHGASVLGTLLSVLMSLHREDPARYFARYLALRRV